MGKQKATEQNTPEEKPVVQQESINKVIERSIMQGIAEGIKSQLTKSYDNPVEKIVKSLIDTQDAQIRSLFGEAFSGLFSNEEFRRQIIDQTRSILAKQLVQKFGGELEKTVNQLKSDPATRARITVAIDEIVRTAKT